VAEFTEIESGKRNDRPELQNALAACKKQRAKLVIAATHLPQTCSKQAIAIAQ
jgi:hypothetical protein